MQTLHIHVEYKQEQRKQNSYIGKREKAVYIMIAMYKLYKDVQKILLIT